MKLSRISILPCLPSATLSSSCFYPAGNQDEGLVPCSAGTTGSSNSICCNEGETCWSPGLCQAVAVNASVSTQFTRSSCTDPTWQADECMSFCVQERPTTSEPVHYCGNGVFCCDHPDCCDDRAAADQLLTIGVPSATAVASQTAAGAATATATTTRTVTTISKFSAKIAIGVAVPVGAVLVLGVAVGSWVLGRRKGRGEGRGMGMGAAVGAVGGGGGGGVAGVAEVEKGEVEGEGLEEEHRRQRRRGVDVFEIPAGGAPRHTKAELAAAEHVASEVAGQPRSELP
ncbi:uncharacterized protein BKCO1_3300076 [Diplodia corticola]|uniref:Uncharacterized protein n=1 Tax=Diplodia corticola TaxID=236234 RepID=A0A1J9QYR4_9PEZI|nr:uncharacterized protein BKCO1_3300076 [Diplodia corticola]OJD33138.1 hypothetical protein BKCO1_3300076 [Diplodia corticola]